MERIPACADENVSLPRDIDDAARSVVTVRTGAAHGSGVIISTEGHVLTSSYVVAQGATPLVGLPGGLELDATVVRIDRRADLALLKIPGKGHRCWRLRIGDRVALGAEVFAIGSPVDTRLAGTITRGVASGYPTRQELIQTDASINPGNSGGPLFDDNGRVIGIVSFKAWGQGVEGLAFGIPVDVAVERLGLDLD